MSLARYERELEKKRALSERGLYPVIAKHILEGLLGYPPKAYAIEPAKQQGVPDLQLFTDDGTAWVAGEVKLDDGELRDGAQLQHLWESQASKYIWPETVYVLLVAPHTVLVRHMDGSLACGVHLEDKRLVEVVTGAEDAKTDRAFRSLLAPISYEEACSQRKYERFRSGEAPSGYIPLNDENLSRFEATFQYGSEALVRYGKGAWQGLTDEYYEEYQAEIARLAQARQDAGSDPEALKDIASLERRNQQRHRLVRQLFEEDYPEFLHSQAYAGTEKEDVFLDVFLTDTSYVLLSRLLFVRMCEDLGLIKKKVCNQGLRVWHEFVTHLDRQYQDLLYVAFRDARSVYRRLFEPTVFDWETETDGEFADLVERILYRLNAFQFGTVDRDFLGRVYQRFLPPKKRKRLGEFYTDDEIVDYILARTGFTTDPEVRAKRLLDPACGSNTFGVRAAARLLDGACDLSPGRQIELVQSVITGFDVNPFAAFIAQMSLLFVCLSQYREAKAADPRFRLASFGVHNVNSLLVPEQVETGGAEAGAADEPQGRVDAFDYVVGNPPCVRNERVPPEDREAINRAYSTVKHKNTDLSAYFVYRALRTWLRPGGRLGFVLSLGLANSDATAKLRQLLKQWAITEVVSLEWMATELFEGADVVPMLLFVEQRQPRPRDPIRVVRGLRTKADLVRCVGDAEFLEGHTSELDRKRWEQASPFGDWCLEVRGEDLDILEHLRKRPTLVRSDVNERVSQAGKAQYGITVGSRAAAEAVLKLPEGPGEARPLLKGLDVARWGVSEPQQAVDPRRLSAVRDLSIWTGAAGAPEVTECVVLPKVYVTLAAAAIDPARCIANDSALVIRPQEWSAHQLAALVNSLPARYYHFLAMRSGVLLRRRSTIYPRTIDNLPWPDLPDTDLGRLDELSRRAHDLAALIDRDEASLLAVRSWRPAETTKAVFLLDFGAWPDDVVLSTAEARAAVVTDGELRVGDKTLVRGGEETLWLLLWTIWGESPPLLARVAAEELALPRDAAVRQAVVAEIQEQMRKAPGFLAELHEVEHEIDELVMVGLGLSPAQREYIRQRCQEFPLSQTVMAPRYLWSEDRKKQALRTYEKGKRFL